jgi:hypothetical protein
MTHSITTISITKLKIKGLFVAQSITTLSLMTFRITTFSIEGLFVALSIMTRLVIKWTYD